MSKKSSVRYYQKKSKKRLKESPVKDIKILLKTKKIESENMFVIDIKIQKAVINIKKAILFFQLLYL